MIHSGQITSPSDENSRFLVFLILVIFVTGHTPFFSLFSFIDSTERDCCIAIVLNTEGFFFHRWIGQLSCRFDSIPMDARTEYHLASGTYQKFCMPLIPLCNDQKS